MFSMKYLITIFLLKSLVYTVFPAKAKFQPVPKYISSIDTIVPGYQEKLQGEVIQFHSSNPYVRNGLVARCIEGKNEIAWKTAGIPSDYKDEYIYFVWLAGFATGNERQNSNFYFYINDEKAFTINIIPDESSQDWLLKGEDGAELSFVQQSLDDNEDSFGYMYLKVPVDNYEVGDPLTLKIVGQNTNRNDDWHITFQHEVKEEVTFARPRPLLQKDANNELQQLIAIHIDHILPQQVEGNIAIGTDIKRQIKLNPGSNEIELWIPAMKSSREVSVKVSIPDIYSYTKDLIVQPVIRRDVHLINHSHIDIGYSDYQPVVIEKQNTFTRQAMQLIDKTKDYPEDAQFIWNIESMWAVENFMNQATEDEKRKLIKYAKDGFIGLPAGYANLLTGICRPEELIHWTDYSRQLQREYGISTKTLMISDVPGISWSVVPTLAEAGVRYISSGPNFIPQPGFPDNGGRVGATHRAWGDKPFYWVSASKQDTILYWQAGKGYSFFQNWNTGRLKFEPKPVNALLGYMQKLQDEQYPYNMVQLRYSIINDNSKPDENIADFVAAWNKKYISPRLIISNVEDMMETFEHRYANKIPVVSGDFTPYWEDGAMSTAKEEVLVKRSVERLYQSEVLNTLLFPGNYDEEKYYQAWRNAIMWHEHTWGAWNSVSKPDEPNVIKQWEYKQNFALEADSLSKDLLAKSIDTIFGKQGFNVLNTSSWIRTDLVILNKEQSTAGDLIVDEKGKKYPSQRLSNGKLAFLAKDIPALGSKRFINKKGSADYKSELTILGNTIANSTVKLTVDENTGAIKSLINKKSDREFVDSEKYKGLNQYLYMPGKDPSKAVSVNNVQIKIKENGPLIATFEISAKAPGTSHLVQEISLINELNKVSIENRVDKIKVREKESVHFAFPVAMQNGQMRIDIGTGILRPEIDQLPGANKDYISMQRWVDISDDQEGITIITNEVPLIEQGELVNEMAVASSGDFGGVSEEKHWKKYSTLSNTFFSYAMNNYWYTNYKADQKGPVTFHYAIYLHDHFDPALASRQGRANGQPLLVTTSTKGKDIERVPFKLNDENILLTSVKPAISGNGVILRLYNASSEDQRLNFTGDSSVKVYLSNASGDKLELFDLQQPWPAYSLKTLYIE